jgi:hypothetical protein
MSWMQTFTGRKFYPLNPKPENIDLRDIAHALALQCRFGGHCQVFYSVAEHSVRVCRALPAEHQPWGLLHDAAEAYLTDIPRPIKGRFGDYRKFEADLLAAVGERFGLGPGPNETVMDMDNTLLATEARDILGPAPDMWSPLPRPLPDKLVPWPNWRDAEDRFLAVADRLGIK